jgi:hypothetical protein
VGSKFFQAIKILSNSRNEYELCLRVLFCLGAPLSRQLPLGSTLNAQLHVTCTDNVLCVFGSLRGCKFKQIRDSEPSPDYVFCADLALLHGLGSRYSDQIVRCLRSNRRGFGVYTFNASANPLEGASKTKAGCLLDSQNLKTATVFNRSRFRLQKQ